MRSVSELPEEYREIYAIDLQKDKKLSVLVNLLALIIAAALVVLMLFVVPIRPLFDMSRGQAAYWLRFGTLIVGTVVYMVLHELVHGAAMKLCGTKKVKYGFTGLYAYAGSDDYYGKKAYVFVALAPIVVWGIVLVILNLLVPIEWFWVVYIIQVANLSGAAGDLFVSIKFSRFPADILVRDHGVGMHVYSKEN